LRKTDVSAAIGDVLNPGLLTVGSIANNTGFRSCELDRSARTTLSVAHGNFPAKYKKAGTL